MLHVIADAASAAFKSRAVLQLENLALRHQIGVLRRSVKRPKLTPADRFLWAVRDMERLVLVPDDKPPTAIAWHRKSLRLFWTWKVRHGKPRRPGGSPEVRDLIQRLSRGDPLWVVPRIHGELCKLSIDIGETSVGKYMVHRRKPPSQTWRTFLEHVKRHGPGRLFHRAYSSVPDPVCLPGPGTRPAALADFRYSGAIDAEANLSDGNGG
jgi:hypothetical protein